MSLSIEQVIEQIQRIAYEKRFVENIPIAINNGYSVQNIQSVYFDPVSFKIVIR
jgi:hypothetical protein